MVPVFPELSALRLGFAFLGNPVCLTHVFAPHGVGLAWPFPVTPSLAARVVERWQSFVAPLLPGVRRLADWRHSDVLRWRVFSHK